MGRLSNISPKTFREYLRSKGLEPIREKGGHEMWGRQGLPRSITLQSHIDPVPEFVIRSNLKTLGEPVSDLIAFLNA